MLLTKPIITLPLILLLAVSLQIQNTNASNLSKEVSDVLSKPSIIIVEDKTIHYDNYSVLNKGLKALIPNNDSLMIKIAVDKYSKQFNVDKRLVNAIILQESNFNPMATSHVGAQGLMQLMPITQKQYGVSDPYNINENVYAGTRHIGYLLRRYKGNKTLAIAAYNAGEGNVNKYGGVPPFNETKNYVIKVLDNERRNYGSS